MSVKINKNNKSQPSEMIIEDGIKTWRKKGTDFFHRENGPAVEYPEGTKEYWTNNNLHKEDGPAVEYASGRKEWYINSELHREDGPAIEASNGDKYWYLRGRLCAWPNGKLVSNQEEFEQYKILQILI